MSHVFIQPMDKMMTHKTAYLSLGSNVGDRLAYLRHAITEINAHAQVTVVKMSSVYETGAWGYTSQNDFFNMAIKIETTLPPRNLLDVCQRIEHALDRTRDIHWGPRTIDIDILLYDTVDISEEFLTIPHKYLLDRPFVTIPLAEIGPEIEVKGEKLLEVATKHLSSGDKVRQMT